VRITGNKRRDVVKEKLAQKNIQTEIYYPRAMHNQGCFQAGPGPYPAAERFCEEILALPLHWNEVPPHLPGCQA
jgi:dTDP-4-amino-4,6-dideoxygalactose transaminase